ncbi:50S ribosomal protein P1 [Candidatus Bathyarchaeota archaeon]|nr:50S ribosomal protein P1 [Candidatus Bathyarchaeota archaeon]
MESVYAALLLHSTGQKINEASLKKVLDAAGVKVTKAQMETLTAALSEVDIDEAIKSAPALAAPAPAAPVASEKKEEEEKEEKKEDEAIQGLGSLFG